MAVTNFTPLLGLALPTTGDLSGTWGATVNTAITDLLDDAVAGTVTLSADADVTLTTTNGADNQARNAVILWTASNGATTRNVTAPAQSKAYIVINAGTGSVVIRGSGPTTGVTVTSGYKALVAWNGSDFVKIASTLVNLASEVTGTLPIANGGTGITSFGTGIATFLGTPSSANLAAALTDETGSGAAVFATSPTLVTPILGTPQSVTLTSATGLPLSTGVTGTLPVANGGTSLTTLTANNVILGNGTSTPLFVAPSTSGNVLTSNGTTWQSSTPVSGFSVAANNTFTGTQSFAGTSSNLAEVLTNAAEVATVSATAATGTINYDVTTQSVLYYTSNASANWTVNFRASSGTSLNTAMTTGQSVTAAFLVTQGATAYYNSVVQVDGSTVTPKYQGGTAYAAGNASSVDVYMYTIIKTGNAAFTVFTSQTKFA